MSIKLKFVLLLLTISTFGLTNLNAQEYLESNQDNKRLYQKLGFYDFRGTNSVDIAIGSSLITGDFPEPEYEIYFRLGYKRFITEHLGASITYNKYNFAFNETFNEGFLSFDFNLEYLMSPFNNISPYVYGGYGYNASSDFETTGPKVQGGLGVEFIVVKQVGIKIFGEYNYVFSKEESPIIQEENSISFLRLGLGLNLYFGGQKAKDKLLEDVDTVIKSNTIK
jgi:curli production assembly/transport component CsgG